MPFDWIYYLSLADSLAAQVDNEAALRSAISRAYYGIYCQAKAQLGYSSNDDIGHKELWKQYERAGGTRRSIGRHGDRLRYYRHQADYYDEVIELPKMVEDSLRTARNVWAYLSSLNPSSS